MVMIHDDEHVRIISESICARLVSGVGGVDQVILDVRFGLLVDLGISPFSHEQSDPSQAFIFSMFFQ